MNFRTVISYACMGALVSAATACSTSSEGKESKLERDPAAAIHQAPDLTRKATSSKWETDTTMVFSAKTVVLRGVGAYHYGKSVGTLDLKMPAETGMKGPLREIITPNALYVQGAPQTTRDKWVKLELPKLAANNLVSSGSMDPSTSLQMLLGVKPGAKRLGTQKLRGVKVEHYSGSLDLRKAAAEVSPEVRPIFAAAMKSLDSTVIPFDLYLDEDGRLRKIDQTMTVPVKTKSGQTKVKIATVTELYDFGTPFAVSIPTKAQLAQAAVPAPAR